MKKIAIFSMVPVVVCGLVACDNGEPEFGQAQSGVESASAISTSSTSSTPAVDKGSETSPTSVMNETAPGEVKVEVDGKVIEEQFTPVVCISDYVDPPQGLKIEGGIENHAEIDAHISDPDGMPSLTNLEIKTTTLDVKIDERFQAQAMVIREGETWNIEGEGVHKGDNDTELPAKVKVRVVCPA
ncbi:lipoprotein LpqH [Corynebacterium freiburgense]|uniref:lipoprotein LpqH n=1 Tax=Corynebacterium freiburgense TaxID=556548 RepID=UPI0004266467|nr:lipoprotein LpqH [Corynebacterium freiburgense]WJZ02058.1 hypothetical protein CFREI_03795 [Corynebacterium freiburgense]